MSARSPHGRYGPKYRPRTESKREADRSDARARLTRSRRVYTRAPVDVVPRPVWSRKSYTCKLTYSDEVTINPGGGGVLSTYSFRANSCYDPDYTGVGHQPRYWDLLTVGWKKYTVLGSKIMCKNYPTTTSTAVTPGTFYVVESGDTVQPYTSVADAREDRVAIISAGPVDGPPKTAVATYSLVKVAGTRAAVADDTYGGNTDGNPGTVRYFHLVGSGLAAADPVSMTFIVTIEYVVRFDNNEIDVGDS